jgi:hypothetical protein
MIRIDHFSLAIQNVYEASDRLRKETGLGFYDGGYSASGTASRIFPLGGPCYIQLEGIVAVRDLANPANKALQLLRDQVSKGDCFRGFALGTDSLEELQIEAQRLKLPVTSNPAAGRTLSDGSHVVVSGAGSATDHWPRGLPIWNYFHEPGRHPAGRPVLSMPGLIQPLGLAEVELGGDEDEVTRWIGPTAALLPLRFSKKAPGVHSLTIRAATGNVRIERPSVNGI